MNACVACPKPQTLPEQTFPDFVITPCHQTPVALTYEPVRLLLPSSQQVPSIDDDNLPVQIRIRRRKQHRARHIPIIAGPPRRHLALKLLLLDLALLIVTALASRHLAGVDAGRNGVDAYLEPVVGHLEGEQLGEVVGGAFGGVVGKVVLCRLGDAGDGGDVDDGAGPAVRLFRRGLQEGEEGGRHEVELRDVGAVDVVPFLEGGLLVVEEVLGHFFGGLGFGGLGVDVDAGVVDEDVETLVFAGDLMDEALDVIFGGDVRGDGDDLAGNVFAVDFDDALQLFFGAAGDVDFGTVDGECLDAHQTDATTAARDEGNLCFLSVMIIGVADDPVTTKWSKCGDMLTTYFALNIEEVAENQILVVGFGHLETTSTNKGSFGCLESTIVTDEWQDGFGGWTMEICRRGQSGGSVERPGEVHFRPSFLQMTLVKGVRSMVREGAFGSRYE